MLTPVFGTCQSDEQVADGEWANAKKLRHKEAY